MPEGDTIRRLAAQITNRFAGELCRQCIARHPRLLRVDFGGQHLVDARAIGKHLFIRFDDGRSIHSHLRMDGSWQLGRRSTASDFHRRIEIELESGWLTAIDMPLIEVVATRDEDSVVGYLGVDVAAVGEHQRLATPEDLLDLADAMQAVGDSALATMLLDQRVVAGFGNVYAVELPFVAGVSPFRRVDEVVGLEHLLGAGVALIRWNAQRNGRNTTGRRLQRADHWVYGHMGSPCPVCATRLRSAATGETPWGRSTTWCPACQPDTGPADVDRVRLRKLLALHPARRDPLMPD